MAAARQKFQVKIGRHGAAAFVNGRFLGTVDIAGDSLIIRPLPDQAQTKPVVRVPALSRRF